MIQVDYHVGIIKRLIIEFEALVALHPKVLKNASI